MDLDLRMVRYAVTVADELHFGRAAARLMIAQQTLSAQISKLEDQLGVALFVRDRRHVELTPAGRVFVSGGRQLLAQARGLLAETGAAGVAVRLDVVAEGLLLAPLIRELRAELPGLPLEVVQGQGLTVAVGKLADGELDIAFGWVRGIGRDLPSGLAQLPVRLDALGVILPAGHPLAAGDMVSLRELSGYPVLVHAGAEAAEWLHWNEEVTSAFGIPVARRVHGHGRASAQAAVQAYELPAFAPLTDQVPSELVLRPAADPVPLYLWSAVWREERHNPAVRRVLGAVQRMSRAHGWLRPPAGEWWLPGADRELARQLSGHGARSRRTPAGAQEAPAMIREDPP